MRLLAHAPSPEQLSDPGGCTCPAVGCPHPDLTLPQPKKEWGKKSQARTKWNLLHFGQEYQHPPLPSPLLIQNVMIDILHLHLAYVQNLWQYTVEVHIHTQEMADKVNEVLKVRSKYFTVTFLCVHAKS